MGGSKLPMHGRDHRCGGSDPIPGICDSSQMLAPNFMRWDYEDFKWMESGFATPASLDGFVCVADATAPFGGYVTSSTLNDHILLGMPLGPRGSIWAVGLWDYRVAGGGTVTFEWATTSVNEYTSYQAAWPNDSAPFGTDKSIFHPVVGVGSSAPVSYYNIAGTGSTLNMSLSPTAWSRDANLSPFVISGTDGQILSQNGVAVYTDWPNSNTRYINTAKSMRGGGDPSLYWWLRIRISSAGTCRIAGVRVYRRDADNHNHA